jgi:pyruvate dehydrogenase E2 component (dihydrolipoamide acetyltransferase)
MTEGTVATWLNKVGEIKSLKAISLLKSKPIKQRWSSSLSTKVLLYIGIEEGGSAPVDSLLAIIGPEGTDISGIAETFKAKGAEERRSSDQLKSLNQHQLKNRNHCTRDI